MMKQGIILKSKINLISKEIGSDKLTSLHVTNTEMFMPPRMGETIIFQGDEYICVDVIHNYDKNTIEVILIDTGVW